MSEMAARGPGDMQAPTTGRTAYDLMGEARRIAAIDDPRQRNQALARVPRVLREPVDQAVQMLFRQRLREAQ